MRVVSFDPGRQAAFAIIDARMPTSLEIGHVDQIGTGRLMRPCPHHIRTIVQGVDAAVVEEVGARPKQGVSSVFTFGLATGSILGALSALSVPVTLVRPQEWKKTCRLNGRVGNDAKKGALAAAKEIWPEHIASWRIQGNHGLADAALMARWYFEAGPGRAVQEKQILI